MNLLTHHKVALLDDNRMYVILMRAVGGEGRGHTSGDVQVVEFHKLSAV